MLATSDVFTFLDALLTLKGERTQTSRDMVLLPLDGGLLNTFDEARPSGNQKECLNFSEISQRTSFRGPESHIL